MKFKCVDCHVTKETVAEINECGKIFRKIAENTGDMKRYIKYFNSKSTSLSFCMDIQQIYGN